MGGPSVASLAERQRVANEALATADALLPAWPVSWPAAVARSFPDLGRRYRLAMDGLDGARTSDALGSARARLLSVMGEVARWVKLGGAGGVPASGRGVCPVPPGLKTMGEGVRQPEARKSAPEGKNGGQP